MPREYAVDKYTTALGVHSEKLEKLNLAYAVGSEQEIGTASGEHAIALNQFVEAAQLVSGRIGVFLKGWQNATLMQADAEDHVILCIAVWHARSLTHTKVTTAAHMA